ncbi:hypothetical protein [Phenylobacterium sp.]|jgi:hypothetical protein|uniref:hypothetical protein n=1 Tax=Phenylobacterium sp. TaxID=1871053 RepID=UPI0037C98BC0
MARKPDDRQVTDLARYRKAREAEKRRPPPRPSRPPILGDNPRAGLILAVVAVVLLALTLGPILL